MSRHARALLLEERHDRIHTLAERVATVLRAEVDADRRVRPDIAFPPDMRGACWSASLLSALALVVRGHAPDIAYDGAIGHAWVEVDGVVVDLTASQFGVGDAPVVAPSHPFSAWERFSLSQAVDRIQRERSMCWHPSWHFDVLARSIARVFDVDLVMGVWTTLALAGPPRMAPEFPMAATWRLLSTAMGRFGEAWLASKGIGDET